MLVSDSRQRLELELRRKEMTRMCLWGRFKWRRNIFCGASVVTDRATHIINPNSWFHLFKCDILHEQPPSWSPSIILFYLLFLSLLCFLNKMRHFKNGNPTDAEVRQSEIVSRRRFLLRSFNRTCSPGKEIVLQHKRTFITFVHFH